MTLFKYVQTKLYENLLYTEYAKHSEATSNGITNGDHHNDNNNNIIIIIIVIIIMLYLIANRLLATLATGYMHIDRQ